MALTLLHNQNRMVDEFGLSAWVAQSKRQVILRSVTSCAGMTAFMVVVAQTKVGLLNRRSRAEVSGPPRRRAAYTEEEDMLELRLPLLVPAKCLSSFVF